MPISVICSACDKKLKVKPEAAGKKVRCPGCDGVISVPKAAKPELDDLEPYDEDDDFVSRKPARKRRKPAVDELEDFDDDELEDDLPTIKPTKKGSKKGKTKSQRASSGDFLTEFYEGQLSRTLAYIFWGIFLVLWMAATTGQTMWVVFVATMHVIVSIRGLINVYWWAKLCSRDSPLGPLTYVVFFGLPFIALICGAMSNDTCEKPNRLFMFSVGILALTWVSAFVAVVIAAKVLGVAGP